MPSWGRVGPWGRCRTAGAQANQLTSFLAARRRRCRCRGCRRCRCCCRRRGQPHRLHPVRSRLDLRQHLRLLRRLRLRLLCRRLRARQRLGLCLRCLGGGLALRSGLPCARCRRQVDALLGPLGPLGTLSGGGPGRGGRQRRRRRPTSVAISPTATARRGRGRPASTRPALRRPPDAAWLACKGRATALDNRLLAGVPRPLAHLLRLHRARVSALALERGRVHLARSSRSRSSAAASRWSACRVRTTRWGGTPADTCALNTLR